MIDPGSNIPPEESAFMENLHTDILKEQARRRTRIKVVIFTLAVSAIILGALIGWRIPA